jgi:hypothetical protein
VKKGICKCGWFVLSLVFEKLTKNCTFAFNFYSVSSLLPYTHDLYVRFSFSRSLLFLNYLLRTVTAVYCRVCLSPDLAVFSRPPPSPCFLRGPAASSGRAGCQSIFPYMVIISAPRGVAVPVRLVFRLLRSITPLSGFACPVWLAKFKNLSFYFPY